MQVALRQHVAEEQTVAEGGDQAVRLLPPAVLLEGEYLRVTSDIGVRQDGRQREGIAFGQRRRLKGRQRRAVGENRHGPRYGGERGHRGGGE